jgi:tetratricopeptide (TPR) repeat protein
MKAEERKALEKNDLEAGFDKMREGLRKGPPRSVMIGLGVILVLVVLFFVWRWLSTRAADTSANLLVTLQQMNDGTDIRALADKVDPSSADKTGSDVSQTARREQLMVQQLEDFVRANQRSVEGRMARLRLARLALFLGERDVTSETPPFLRVTAQKNLTTARNAYNQLVTDYADTPLLQQEALLNQGRACESLGEFDQALKLYQQASKDSSTPSGERAKQEAERLEKHRKEAEELFHRTLGSLEK